jgi:hypothetical protein
MRKIQALLGFTFLTIITSIAAHAGASENDASITGFGNLGDQSYFDANISGSDLLTGAEVSGTTPDLGPYYGSSLAGINDGAASNGLDGNPAGEMDNDTYYDTTTLAGNPTVTFTLNTVANPGGYTLASINSIDGWNTHSSLSDQDFSVYYSTVGDSSDFTLLYTVAYNPFDPADDNVSSPDNSSQVTLTGLTAPTGGAVTGAAEVRFVFSLYSSPTVPADGQNGQVIREIDVFGDPTEIPEPSIWAMLLVGVGTLLVMQRLWRKRSF